MDDNDSTYHHHGSVFVLLYMPVFITLIVGVGKFLFDNGILFMEHYFYMKNGNNNDDANNLNLSLPQTYNENDRSKTFMGNKLK